MNKHKIEDIKAEINICNMRLKTIMPHLTQDKVALNESFNRLLIQKAVLKDKLTYKSPSFIQKISKKFSNNRELICDYFK